MQENDAFADAFDDEEYEDYEDYKRGPTWLTWTLLIVFGFLVIVAVLGEYSRQSAIEQIVQAK